MKYNLIIGERSQGRKKAMNKMRTVYEDFVEVFLKTHILTIYELIKKDRGMDYFVQDILYAWEWYKHDLQEEVDKL